MLFRSKAIVNPYARLIEKIEKDLFLTFEKKGIDISKIQIAMRPNNVNVQVYIKGNSIVR